MRQAWDEERDWGREGSAKWDRREVWDVMYFTALIPLHQPILNSDIITQIYSSQNLVKFNDIKKVRSSCMLLL